MARIIPVADAYDAMTSDRAYRNALPHDATMSEINRCAGTQFDPIVVTAVLAVIEAEAAPAAEPPLVLT